MKDIEIEIKVKIEHSNSLLDFLERNAKFQKEQQQVDEYFLPSHRDFTEVRPVKEWLRLRDSSGKKSINYKNWHHDDDGKSHYCSEYETEIEDLNQLKKILDALNFKSVVTVDKVRKTWVYKDYEIAIDLIKELGDFIEIEYAGNDEKLDPKKVTEEMVSFLKDIGCGRIERYYVGYAFQLLFPGEVEFEEQ